MKKQEYPILEFSSELKSVIEPSELFQSLDIAECAVICFFKEIIEKVVKEYKAKVVFEDTWECGKVEVFEFEYNGKRVAVTHPYVGAPIAASILEEMIALGCRKFIVCAGAGVLDKKIAVGHLMIPESAIRDEGTSYHYIPPSREISASEAAVKAIEKILKSRNVEYLLSKTWSTDGVFRETPEKIKLRKSEGCLTVEMEAAALFAVASFRDVSLGYILYGGDDISGKNWDKRGWKSRSSIRENLFWLAVEACQEIE